MQYAYDSYNRIQTITYPDGETVSYRYDRGGMLESVRGDKGGDHRTYIEDISYNTYGLKESVFYGNGTHTDYGYDLLMRLSHLYSENGFGEAMQDIDYGYDDADNITDIFNNAATLANGLGGNYRSHYDYDNLYRLGHAEGDWGGGQLNYHLDMQYHPNGRIERKELYADVMDHTGTVTVSNYSNSYQYNAGQPNTLDYVMDDLSGWDQHFSWDAAGNMTIHDHFAEGCSRQMCWDEENRLAGFSDCHNAGFYQYDANGERTYKLTGGYAAQNIQGHWWSYHLLNSPTLYASPYMVATPQGYTKHYYAESERIASRIGNGGLEEIDLTVENIEDLLEDVWVGETPPVWEEVGINEYYRNKQEDLRNHLTDVMMCAGTNPAVESDLLSALHDYWRYVQGDDETASEPDCYWYHPDHLGSSSWITYTDGEAVQHLHYLPWGEEFVDQRITDFSARHTFSAKERDAETGLSYFGARYYSSDLSIWLSVDPMSDKYPSLSPYVYCADNPVKLVDPNGEEIGNYYDRNGTYLGTDGKNDGEVYVVVTRKDKKKIKKNDKAGGTTQVSDVKSAMRLPLPKTRQEIYNQMTEGDKANGFAEHGGIYGIDLNTNKETARPAAEGPICDPTDNNTVAPIDYNTVDIRWFIKKGTYHCHPSGEKNGSYFIQQPSETDYNNAKKRAEQNEMTGTNMVFGMRNNRVYLYNSTGYRATMSVQVFLNLR
ncbi:MAG: RHS repeat-associated core domain-containing protein [Bacteroidales bacterium]|nr:RHS repeat-associated core domain-containing protein [Bacteroidales bacterium]